MPRIDDHTVPSLMIDGHRKFGTRAIHVHLGHLVIDGSFARWSNVQTPRAYLKSRGEGGSGESQCLNRKRRVQEDSTVQKDRDRETRFTVL